MSYRVGLHCRRILPAVVLMWLTSCSAEEDQSSVAATAEATSEYAELSATADATEADATEADATGGDQSLANLENGAFVFTVAHCTGCHNGPDDPETGRSGYMAGGDFAPGMYVANVTQDVETGIGGWTDDEIEILLRSGVRPDGTTVHGVMPFGFLRSLTDVDMRDLIAHLRTIPPVDHAVPRSGGEEMAFPSNMFVDFPAPPTAEEVGEQVARGAYLATVAHCMGCHTYVNSDGTQDFENSMGNGGLLLEGPVPAVSANITPHMEDGIGTYSVEDIVHVLRTGTRPDGTALAPIMGTRDLEHLPQPDLEAIAVYLKWLPPQPSPVPAE